MPTAYLAEYLIESQRSRPNVFRADLTAAFLLIFFSLMAAPYFSLNSFLLGGFSSRFLSPSSWFTQASR